MTQLAIFASGTGTNAKNIIDHFRHHPIIKVSLIVCNRPGAGVLDIAREAGIPELLIEKEPFFQGYGLCDRSCGKAASILSSWRGFYGRYPEALIKAYPRRIINIHPALLPKTRR